MLLPWIIFVLSSVAIIFAGRKLSQYGDEIAAHTGLGRAFVGSILLAGATSLPEVAASLAAAVQGWGNLAMGNVFGSNVFNIAIIALAQLFAAKPILASVSRTHITVASAGMLLSGIAAIAMVMKSPLIILGAGVDAMLIAVVYIMILRILPKEEEAAASEVESGDQPAAAPSATMLYLKFAAAAVVVILAGWFLSISADQIAAATGLGQTFVGSTLLALATSLPEVAVTIFSAMRGSYDLALGNVLGSNIFNMLILVIADFGLPGPVGILATASQGQIVSALVGLVLSGIAVLGLTVPERKSKRPFQWDAAAIAITWAIGTYFLYALR